MTKQEQEDNALAGRNPAARDIVERFRVIEAFFKEKLPGDLGSVAALCRDMALMAFREAIRTSNATTSSKALITMMIYAFDAGRRDALKNPDKEYISF